MKTLNIILTCGLLTTLGIQPGVTVLQADDNDPHCKASTPPVAVESGTAHPTPYHRASCLIGMKVYNETGQHLGRVKDIVIDNETDRVSYAVLSVRHGFLGLNQKLLAVPFSAFNPGQPGLHLVLNADRKNLELARGFSAHEWPNPKAASWGAAPSWKEGKTIEPVSMPMEGGHKKTTQSESTNQENPEPYAPGSLGYPGW